LLAAAFCAGMANPAARAAVSVPNDGADGRPAAISIHSIIARGDFAAFAAAADRIGAVTADRLNDVPHITVELESPGGDLVEAIEIGRLIHERFMMTLVRPGRQCVSACVLVLIAGAVHTPADGATIGLHRPLLLHYARESRDEAYAKFDAWMAYLREYFHTLGVSDVAYDLMMKTHSNRMRYFSPSELDELGLRGEDPAWEALYNAKWAQATAKSESAPRQTLAAQLPPVAEFEKYRTMFVMPTAAELEAPPPPQPDPQGLAVPFVWQSLDDHVSRAASTARFDPRRFLTGVELILVAHLRAFWILALIAVFEIFRNRDLADQDDRDRWRRKSW
jgi:hypothetical protein